MALTLSCMVLLGAGAIGWTSLIPPAVSADFDATAFSAVKAFDHIERIAGEPRPIGSPANQRTRNYVVTRLREMGLVPELQTIEASDYFGGFDDNVSVVNVMARVAGTDSTGAVAMVGHYDTVPTSPGASDDGSAVAIMLESARAILADPPLRNDVIFLFTDGEEPAPRFGSSAFVAGHSWAGDVGFVINLEAAGSGGPSIVTEINGAERRIIERFVAAVPYPVAFSFLTATTELIGGSTSDFASFRARGIPGVELTYLHGSPIYHTWADSPDRLSLRSLQQQGANALALTRHLGDVDLGPSPDDSDSVFFTIGRGLVLHYPTAWALPIVLFAGAVLAGAVWRQRLWRRMLRSAGATILNVVVAAGVAVGIWSALAGWRSTMSVTESYLYLAGLAALTMGIGTALVRLTRRKTGTGPDATGVVAVWWGLGMLSTVAAPGMSYLFVWPAMAGGLALLWRSEASRRGRWQFVRLVVVAVAALALLVPPIDTFYQLAQPRPGNPDSEILFFIAIPVVLLSLVVELIRVFWLRPTERLT